MTTRRLFSKTATRSALCKVRAGRLVAGQNLLFFIILPLSCDIVGALYSLIIIGHYPTGIWQPENRPICVELIVVSIPCQLCDIYWPGSREKSLSTCISPRKWQVVCSWVPETKAWEVPALTFNNISASCPGLRSKGHRFVHGPGSHSLSLD